MPKQPPPGPDRLADYRAKRSADATPEPFGGTERSRAGIFVVQKHAATRLHYDLRLEHQGVLLSWAVPAGIALDPDVKRFAAHTEDHPLEYADFEGVIPADEYGGGEMIVWDRGSLRWDEDPETGLEKGKLLFSLAGYKLHGQWTLVQMKKNPNEWLLIKKPDGWHKAEDDTSFNEQSVFTGRLVEDLKNDDDPSVAILALLAEAGATETAEAVVPEVMLASKRDEPFDDDNWLFEVKYDGYRMTIVKRDRNVRLRYRSGLDATSVFPEIVAAVRRLPFENLTLDGEVVVLDENGLPSFQLLQKRGRLSNKHEILAASASRPATFFGFDLLAFNTLDTRPVPQATRKEALRMMHPTIGPLRFADHFIGIGVSLFTHAAEMGLEGVVAKRADAPYVAGRSEHWLKIRSEQHGIFAIVGYTHPEGSRTGIGALHIAGLLGGGLSYAGRVGTGINQSTLRELHELLDAESPNRTHVSGAPDDATSVWVTPTLQSSIRFKEVTETGSLRQPVFEDFADLDRSTLYELDGDLTGPPDPAVIDARSTDPTNIDKVFWPEDGYTKGDLIRYYTAVADALLPYLENRPLVLDRYPDGIDGKSFFQKNAPEFVPDWIRTQWVGEEDKGNNYFIANDVESLRYLANLAAIPIHVWASRLPSIASPDWCILDLDPKEAPFGDVVSVAQEIKRVCDAMDLPCYPKTSGKSGLHVLIPMGSGLGYDQQKLLGELIARVVEARTGDIATTVRNPRNRDGKVYLDYLQNGRGKLIVSPYSVRPVQGATVSAPLRWSEVMPSLDVTRYTIKSMPRRIASMKSDPLTAVLTDAPDIKGGLAALANEYSA